MMVIKIVDSSIEDFDIFEKCDSIEISLKESEMIIDYRSN